MKRMRRCPACGRRRKKSHGRVGLKPDLVKAQTTVYCKYARRTEDDFFWFQHPVSKTFEYVVPSGKFIKTKECNEPF